MKQRESTAAWFTPSTGDESMRAFVGKLYSCGIGGAESEALTTDPTLRDFVQAWSTLDNVTKGTITTIIQNRTSTPWLPLDRMVVNPSVLKEIEMSQFLDHEALAERLRESRRQLDNSEFTEYDDDSLTARFDGLKAMAAGQSRD